MKKKTVTPAPISTVQSQALNTSQDQQRMADQSIGQSQNTLGTAQNTLGTQQQAVSPYLAGSNGMSEFRRALTGSLAHSTAVTGENAIARSRERAQAAGFGSTQQPITFGAENQLANEQAGRIAQIPAQVEQQAAPLELQAAGQVGDIAGRENQIAGQYGSLAGQQEGAARGYFGEGANLEQQRMADFYKQQEEARKRKAGIWGSLAKIGMGFIPGVGGLIGGLGGGGGDMSMGAGY